VCISWTNKEFDIINARCNHEDYQTSHCKKKSADVMFVCVFVCESDIFDVCLKKNGIFGMIVLPAVLSVHLQHNSCLLILKLISITSIKIKVTLHRENHDFVTNTKRLVCTGKNGCLLQGTL
jgi:hypothetical protein